MACLIDFQHAIKLKYYSFFSILAKNSENPQRQLNLVLNLFKRGYPIMNSNGVKK
jgi:hypothetical protein